jgi:hypothetical protein
MASAKPPSKFRYGRNHSFDILRAGQPVIAVLDERQYDIVARKSCREIDRMLPGHVLIHDALENTNRTTGLNHATEQQMVATLLDQAARYRIRFL